MAPFYGHLAAQAQRHKVKGCRDQIDAVLMHLWGMVLFVRSYSTMLPVTGKHQAAGDLMNSHIVRSDSGLMLIAKSLMGIFVVRFLKEENSG